MDREMCHNSIVSFPTHPLECVQIFFFFFEQHGNYVLLYNTIKYMLRMAEKFLQQANTLINQNESCTKCHLCKRESKKKVMLGKDRSA